MYIQTKKFKDKENVTYHYIISKGIRMSTQRRYPFEEAKKGLLSVYKCHYSVKLHSTQTLRKILTNFIS